MLTSNKLATSVITLTLTLLFALVNMGYAANIEKLKKKAKEKGKVPIIVGLQLPEQFIPEGKFGNRNGIEKQRKSIKETRQKFFDKLSSTSRGNYKQYAQWDSLPYVAMKANAKAIDHLATDPMVISIGEDVAEEPNLASTADHIGSDNTWDAGYGGLGQTVVILDTGIDNDHPFFGNRIVWEACFSNGPGVSGDQSLCGDGSNSQSGFGSADATVDMCWATVGDDTSRFLCDHGTHVAGIAAGRDPGGVDATGFNGVAPDANIIAIQVFTRITDAAECGSRPAPCVLTYASDQLSALNYINTNLLHWHVASVNMSLGGGEFTDNCDDAADNHGRKAAIDNLLSNDVATVISSGNSGYTDALGRPGCITTAVTVGAVRDPGDDVIFNMHPIVDLLAVGADIDSSVPDDVYGNKGGTSMAAPQVTGAFAMLKAFDPSFSAGDIENLLKDTGVDVRDERDPCDFSATGGRECLSSGVIKPRIQLDVAIANNTEADLIVFKDCKPDDPMLVGEEAICTIRVRNLGTDPALGVLAIDEYVSNGTFTIGTITTTAGSCTSTPNPQVNQATVECDLGSILMGNTVTIEIPITADEPQNINDLASAFGLTPDPDSENNYAEDEVNVSEIADLQVFKDCTPDEPMLAGEVAICDITVRNWGPSEAVNVVLTDTHTSNGAFSINSVSSGCSESGGIVECSFGDLAVDEEISVRIEISSDNQVNINDTATVASDTYDPNNMNNSASDGVGVDPVADLTLTKTATPLPVTAGTQLTYELMVFNNGPSEAINVVIEDVLPLGVTIDSVTSTGGTCNTGVPGNGALPTTCTFDSLAVGVSETMVVSVTVLPQSLGLIGNNARVYSDVYDTDNSDNLATVDAQIVASADLTVSKSDSPDPVYAGEVLSYEITIENSGPSTAVDVSIGDILPQEVHFVDYVISNGFGTCVATNQPGGTTNVECDLNNLNPGEFVSVSINVLVDSAVTDSTYIFNTVTASSGTVDPDVTDNSVTEDTFVYADADLVITKEANFLTDNPSEGIVYTLLVSNLGPSDALDVSIVDTLPLTPKKVVYVMDSGDGACMYDESTHTVTCNTNTLVAGDSVSVDIVVDAKGSVREISNIAEVQSSTFDADTLNNVAVKNIFVKGGSTNKKVK